MTRFRAVLLVFFAGLAGLPGCSAAPGAPGGRLIVTLRTEPKGFNRLVSISAPENLITYLTQATLIRVNRTTQEIEPRLATSWTASPDGLTWTMKLREGVTFSDGAPFTAADVLFTFQALFDPRVGSAMASSFMIGGQPIGARGVDDHTVLIVFPSLYGPGIRILDSLPILPRHKLEAALTAGTFGAAWNVTTDPKDVVGLGPFVLAEYVSGQHVRLARNPKFWKKDDAGKALPRLDEIEIQIVPEQNGELLRIASGQSDLTSDWIRPADRAALQSAVASGVVTLAEAGVDIAPDALWFDLAPGAPHAKAKPWLQKDELRQAISYAVDRQAIVDTVYLGAAVPVYGPITPGHGEWYDSSLPKTERDLPRAKALLAKIGLVDRNGDGMLEDAKGQPAGFSILTIKGNTIRGGVSAMLQQQLKQVGLAVEVIAAESGQVRAQWAKGDYDAIYYGVVFDAFDPARNSEFWTSGGSFHFWNPGQIKPATAWEAQIDDLMKRQATSLDPNERHKIFFEAQRVLADHLPCLYFAAPKVTVAVGARVSGAQPSVLQPTVLWNAEMLSVGPAPRR